MLASAFAIAARGGCAINLLADNVIAFAGELPEAITVQDFDVAARVYDQSSFL